MELRPIDVFVHYDGKRADDIAASRFAVRQLIAQAASIPRSIRVQKADRSRWTQRVPGEKVQLMEKRGLRRRNHSLGCMELRSELAL